MLLDFLLPLFLTPSGILFLCVVFCGACTGWVQSR